jgi:formamidopyrimidine-DNA glycosylase
VLHAVRILPARQLRTLDDATLELIASTAATMLHGPRPQAVYGRRGKPCPRCGTLVTSGVVGDDGRRSYWCPGCQT